MKENIDNCTYIEEKQLKVNISKKISTGIKKIMLNLTSLAIQIKIMIPFFYIFGKHLLYPLTGKKTGTSHTVIQSKNWYKLSF